MHQNVAEVSNFYQEILQYERDLFLKAVSYFKGDEASAEDLLQDTILRAMANEEKFQKGTNLRAWLHTIMYHLFVNKFRKKKRSMEILEEHRATLEIMEDYVQSPGDNRDWEILAKTLKENMTPIFFETLDKVDREGYSYQEVSDEINVPIGTVMSRLFRARQKARSILEIHYGKEFLLRLFQD